MNRSWAKHNLSGAVASVLATLFLFIGSGCGTSGDSPSAFSPAAVAAQAPTPSVQVVNLGGTLKGRTDEVISLKLTITDGLSVEGQALLTRGTDAIPLVVKGTVAGIDSNVILDLFPDDIAPTESFQLSGILASGGSVVLRQTGADQDYAEVLLSDQDPVTPKVYDRTSSGGTETYQVFLSTRGPVDSLNPNSPQSYTLKATFDSGSPYTRSGSYQLTADTPGGDVSLLGKGDGPAVANFYVFSTWVRLDLYGDISYRGQGAQFAPIAALYFRPNDNSFFSGGVAGESVAFDSDSWLKTKWLGPVTARNREHICELRTDPNSKITLISGGK